jgi:hypothetical protein
MRRIERPRRMLLIMSSVELFTVKKQKYLGLLTSDMGLYTIRGELNKYQQKR